VRNCGSPWKGKHAGGRASERDGVTVFDPERIIELATYDEPIQDPEGIRYVLVNGQPALEDGRETKVPAGRVCGKTWRRSRNRR